MELKLDWDTPVGAVEATLDPFANESVSATLPEETAKKRALKVKVAFSGEDQPPSYEDILRDVQSNREDRLRDRLAQSEAIKKQGLKQQIIREVVDSGDSSPEALTFLQSLSLEDITQPEGILEKKYAEWRMNMGLSSDESGTVDRALEANPDAVNERVDSSVDRLHRKERMQAFRDRMDAQYQQTGWGRTAIDFVSDMVPGFTAVEDRNLLPDNVQVSGFMPGEARRSQIRDMAAMSVEEFDATLAKLEEQALASGDFAPVIKFADDYAQYSAYGGMVDNTWALLSGMELVPGVGLIGDVGLGLGKAGVRAGSVKAAQKAAREAVQGGVSKGGSRKAAEAAVGTPEAVVEPTLSPKEEALSNVAEAVSNVRGTDGKLYTVDGRTVSGPDPDVVPAPPKVGGAADDVPHVVTDIPNPRTGGTTSVQVPATDENLAKIYTANTEQAAMAGDDLPDTFVAHGDADRGAFAEAAAREALDKVEPGVDNLKKASEALARRLPSLIDPVATVIGRPASKQLSKLVNKLADKYKSVLDRQKLVNKELWKAYEASQTMGAIRWSDEVFSAVQDAVRAQMNRYVKAPSEAILDVKYLREWETGFGRTNQIVYNIGAPDGRFFVDPRQAATVAKDFYGLADGAFSVESLTPGAFTIRVAKVVDETDPDILKHAIQTDTTTPVSWTGTFLPYFRGSAGVSSEMLQKNLAVSQHHAKALHSAFMVAAKDIGKLSKKEMRNLDALMEAKRDVEKIVIDPVSGKETKVRGEWFNSAGELERVYKKAFGEYPSEDVVSAYFTMRQMYDFDLMVRNFKLYSEKTRVGIENARLHIPVPDSNDPSLVKWLPQKKGVEVKFVEDLPAGDFDILILNAETAQGNYINTAKSGREGIKDLQSKGYKLMQIANPDQRPLKNVNDNYIQYVVAKDVERTPLTPDQLPATEGGHVRYKEGFFVKQPRFETTSNGERLYLGDRPILGASSAAEGAKHAKNMEIGRQLMLAGDFRALGDHLSRTLPWTVGQFEQLFKASDVEEALLDKDTPITWVADGQGVNDAAKTHATELAGSFTGVRDTIDDPTNIYGTIGKKYTGEKDFALRKVVTGEGDKLFDFDKARMISPMETLEQAWAEISRSIATDNMKVQASTNWVEEAAQALKTPIEELRRNPWEALNNPQWNTQYGDPAKIRTLDIQRRQILAFLGQKDQLGSTLDWIRNKALDGVFNKKGQAAADWVDDNVLPNVRNPLQFMRSFAFHTKLGLFNPVQLFLQSNAMINTWAITGNPARVGSALSGVTLMQMSRVNRTPEILSALAKKSEKLGWKPGEWLEMDELFHKLSLHLVEGEVGMLDVMTNPKMFKGVGGNFLDKGLFFFREGERAVRMNAWAVAFKEFRDKFPTKVLNNSDVNSILRRQEILAGNMTRGSNALWQKGITGPMTQFWGYQARITEQLLGKQLTRAEKLRLGTAFAAMYGVPVSLSAATFMQIPGWSTDDIRQYALENNIDINSGIAGAAMNGIPSELIRWMTSDENGQGGIQLAIGDRYGPGGLPVLKNLVEAKDGVTDAIIDLAFGASGSITRDFFAKVLPENWDILESAVNGPRLGLQDYANMFSTISTVNNSTKLYWALTTHKAMTRDGLSLGDKSAVSAWITFTTGLDEQRFKDTFLKIDSMKDLKTATDELGKEYVKQIRQAKLLLSGSEERAAKIRKARALLEGMDPKEVRKFVKQAFKGQGDLDEAIDKSFEEKFKE
jgi:hypothetical protein